MKRKKIMLCGIAMINILLFSILSTSASSWTDSGKVSNLPTWGNVKDLNKYNKKQQHSKPLRLILHKYLLLCHVLEDLEIQMVHYVLNGYI